MALTSGRLLDPNEAVSPLPNYVNGAPDYEKMYIFAELIAKRRGRTTLVRSGVGTSQQLDGLENDISINMMGFDQDTKQYTTRYSQNEYNNKKRYEGFGITSIDVKINASYVPQVTIEFIDIRGMSFANKSIDSPYIILLDFPPPTFTLTLKGYYGRALTYNLHLTKNSIKFDSTTGNYAITSEFIASTYAPLSDVPFKYIEMFPMIDIGTERPPETTLNPDGTKSTINIPDTIENNVKTRPKNTLELIKNTQRLYDGLKKLLDSSDISREYKESLEYINAANLFSVKMANFTKYIKSDLTNGSTMGIVNTSVDTGSTTYFRRITTLADYNTTIKSAQAEGLKDTFPERLYLLILRKNIKAGNMTVNFDAKDKEISTALEKLRKELLEDGNRIDENISKDDNSPDITNIKIKNVTYTPKLISVVDLENNSNVIEYYGIDVTIIYQKIYKKWIERKQDSSDKRQQFIDEINTKAIEQLGMNPSIYNVFEILCNDVDLFFDKLRASTIEGEQHHEEFKNQIINRSDFPDKKIGGYPRFVKVNPTGNSNRNARSIPDRKAFPDIRIFPEVQLVDDFVNVFANIKKYEEVENLKTKTDAEGNSVWIPVTPADSVLYGGTDYNSPYFDLYYNTPDSTIMGVFEIALNRFYLASEFTFGKTFFTDDTRTYELIKYIGLAEGNNVVASINNLAVLNSLKTAAEEFRKRPEEFYKLLNNRKVKGYSSLNNNPTSPYLEITNGVPLYRQRKNTNFVGIKIIEDSEVLNGITERTTSSETSSGDEIKSYKSKDVVDKFLDEIKPDFLENMTKLFFGKITDVSIIENFITENMPYFKDEAFDNNFNSDFIKGNSFTSSWSTFLSATNSGTQYDRRFKEILNTSEYKNATKLFIISTNATDTLGFLNDKYLNLKQVVSKFLFPAYVQTPVFSLIYMGGLVKYGKGSADINSGNTTTDEAIFKTEVDKYFTNDIGKKYDYSNSLFGGSVRVSNGLELITYEAPLVANLSENEKEVFEDYFDRKLTDTFFGKVEDYFIDMIEDYYTQSGITDNVVESNRETFYNDSLMGEGKNDYEALSRLLNDRVGVLNFSELTFNKIDETKEYVPLESLLSGTTVLGKNVSAQLTTSNINTYFTSFFEALYKNIEGNLDKIEKEELETQNLVSDDDIRTQTYYSFKSLADKWLTGNGDVKGFPFNTNINGGGERLIDKFIFVDRGMNPIGDQCIINIESLIDMSKNYDISVFNAMAKLLSVNNFEFFPIANFMAFTDGEWDECFKIKETVEIKSPPAFVCMYIGGTASTLSGTDNAFDDDGILDLETDGDVGDINKNATLDQNLPEVRNVVKRFGENNPFGRVSAFRVRFSEQNQSFFKNISIDTREFPETNESLAILSKLAGDESGSSPVAKGQNLYSIYESRAYSANVDMLGNMMIQPTQYFQLENIPIFNGAYMILNVSHNFTPNHATTSFSGTKILKYPNPFVTDIATAIALIGGTGNETLGEEPTSSDAFGDNGEIPEEFRPNNSQYVLKIK